MLNKKSIVIGAGIAGLATAIRLRKQGFEVKIFESAHIAGGKIREYTWQDFRFDCGPSLFTLPELVDELFVLCGKNPGDYFNYRPLQSITRYFYEDGIEINAFAEPGKFAKEVKDKLKVDEEIVLRFLQKQEKSYRLLAPIFLENSIHQFAKLFKFRNIPALWHVSNPKFLWSMNKVNHDWFRENHLISLFNRYGTYNGSNPYVMPSLFNIISHLEHNVGAYLPEKGMKDIVNSVYKLAVEEGVEFEFGSYVDKINVEEGKATGIRSNGMNYMADVVVSNMDVNNTFSKLLPEVKPPKIYLNNQKSTSALIFHWSIVGEYPKLDLHNILFANDYKEEFECLFDKQTIYYDPTIYIYISSKMVKTDAPQNHENWFVMINTPHLGNWKLDVDAVKKNILRKIEKYTSIKIGDRILNENIITPEQLAETTHSYLGSLYGASSNSIISAFLRHPNFSKVRNLYFCGGTVHPGGGIPLALMSAKIAASLINENYHD